MSVVAHKETKPSVRRRRPFHLHIQALFTALIFLTGAVLVWSSYQQGQSVLISAAEDLFDRIERESSGEILALRAPVETVVEWISRAPITDAETLETRMQSLPALVNVLNRQARLESVYVGYFNGDFFQVHALRNDADRKRFDAPRHAAFRVQSIERSGGSRVHFILLDSALNEISRTAPPPDYAFDPRTRPWYVESMRSTELVDTQPYVFFTTRQVGQTIAQRAEHGRAVVGADLTLSQLSETLALARPTPSSQLAVFTADHGVIAYSEPGRMSAAAGGDKPTLARIADLSPVMAAGALDVPRYAKRQTIEAGGNEWLLKIVPMAVRDGQKPAYLAIAVPSDELLTAARSALQRHVWLALCLVLLTVPFTWWISRRIAHSLASLTHQAAAIRRFDFAAAPPLDTRVREIFELGETMNQMRETIRKFLDISQALSRERNFDRLVHRVLDEALSAAGSEGAVLYLLEDDGVLKPAAQKWRTPNSAAASTPPDLSMTDLDNPVVRAAAASPVSASHQLGARRPQGLEFIDGHFGKSPVMLVTSPMLNRTGAVTGVLCVWIPEALEAVSPERLALVDAFVGTGAIAIDNQRLLEAQKKLLDSLIQLVAGAIDAKSAYTGGHCERVPALTNMLARAACDAREGPFADFGLDDDGWEALKIAGGLHDCGKVTTPEYVVDKSTKLETLYDRIHEIRMRFEVLKRDAEIASLKAIAAGADESESKALLRSELDALDEEFAFVASCNTGGEFMAAERVQRLRTIAGRTWQRTLDDRLGISWEEGLRKAATPAPDLPTMEHLLADKPEHILERGPRDIMPDDNPWGFKLAMPPHLYNRGELHNLAVARGTLTDEERYKINDHIVQTIIMLSQLPFPKHLKSVPELAGGHHEKMDGTGYPKRLYREGMSVQARIMAIADIFEALTATDRPYKKGKMLSEAIKIMSHMRADRHIDPDLFDLFLRSGVYRDYAEKYLKPEFIDTVDLDTYLANPVPA